LIRDKVCGASFVVAWIVCCKLLEHAWDIQKTIIQSTNSPFYLKRAYMFDTPAQMCLAQRPCLLIFFVPLQPRSIVQHATSLFQQAIGFSSIMSSTGTN
jgi:hypothetical protein